MSRCPARDCRTPCQPGKVACKLHWFSLPRELRRRIWVTYRREPGGEHHMTALKEALRLLVGVPP